MRAQHCDPPASDHFDGKRFFLPWLTARAGFKEFLKWKLSDGNVAWPKELPPDFLIRQSPPRDRMNFTQFINHASVLLDVSGMRFAIDPVFSERAGPFNRLGPKRAHATPFDVADFGVLDAVMVSHNHYDHMDAPALHKIAEIYPSARFIVPLRNESYLVKAGIARERITELDWWESTELAHAKITLIPSQHWSRRTFADQNFALWGGFVIEDSVTSKKYNFVGDSGYGPHFRQIQERWRDFDLCFVPIGAYEPRWFMKYHHMNPDEAALTHIDLHSKKSLAIHHACFKLTDEGWDAPVRGLEKALRQHGIDKKDFLVPRPGEIFDL